ncbi:MAG: DUF4469 domain-containing protein [Tannerella sp.]|jgi:hypothetical protein|nr:DUF4469 domain-containing protein [Tannerella sp.]
MLQYSLRANLLTDRPDDFSAQPHPNVSYDRDGFIDQMLKRGTTLTRTDILAVFNSMEETAASIVEEGDEFHIPLVQTGFRMPGVYNGATDSFDPARHELLVATQPGTLLREAVKRIRLVKIHPPSPQPQILQVKDSVTGQVDTVLTVGGAVDIAGVHIKVAGIKSENGLYFVRLEGGAETKAATLVTNNPSQLIALIPPLGPGTYHVKVTTQYSHAGKLLNDCRTVVFAKTLTVS